MRFQKSDQKTQVSQKKRTVAKRTNANFKHIGSAAFFFLHQIQLEFIYLRLIRRRVRLMLKKRGHRYRYRRVWLNLKANFPISKKSKNSRMGKGNGLLLRWVVRLKPLSVFLSFFGFSFYVLKKLMRRINFLLKSKICLVHKLKKITMWASPYFSKISSHQRRVD